MLKGYDVSHWNGPIPDDAEYVLVKATEGRTSPHAQPFTDPTYHSRVKEAADRKLPLAAYHFFHASDDPAQQARLFLSVVGDVQTLALDYEQDSIDGMGKHDCATRALAFCRELANAGRHVIVYIDRAMAREGYCQGLDAYPLWIADPSSGLNPHSWTPDVPHPWGSAVLWQTGQHDKYDVDYCQSLDWLKGTVPGKPDDGHSPKPGKVTDVNLGVLQAQKDPHYSGETEALQALLNHQLAKHGVADRTAVDGLFGPDTTRAVREVQRVLKVGVDGIVGPETWAHLLGVK